MPRAPRVDLVHKAICAGHLGQIAFKPSCVDRLRADPEMDDWPEQRIKELLRDFIRNKHGQCECREEQPGSEWLEVNPEDPWWYFAVVPFPRYRRGLFLKFKLLWEDGDDEDEAFIQIVNYHEER